MLVQQTLNGVDLTCLVGGREMLFTIDGVHSFAPLTDRKDGTHTKLSGCDLHQTFHQCTDLSDLPAGYLNLAAYPGSTRVFPVIRYHQKV